MNEKVLGFCKKDAKRILGHTIPRKIRLGGKLTEVTCPDCEDCLVPVVSVKWLENFCNKNGKNVITNHEEVYVCIPKEDLLKAVRLQSLSVDNKAVEEKE